MNFKWFTRRPPPVMLFFSSKIIVGKYHEKNIKYFIYLYFLFFSKQIAAKYVSAIQKGLWFLEHNLIHLHVSTVLR
jgi:hypothetical protein